MFFSRVKIAGYAARHDESLLTDSRFQCQRNDIVCQLPDDACASMQECGSRDLSLWKRNVPSLQGGSRSRARRMRQPQTTKQDGCRLPRAAAAPGCHWDGLWLLGSSASVTTPRSGHQGNNALMIRRRKSRRSSVVLPVLWNPGSSHPVRFSDGCRSRCGGAVCDDP